MSMPGQSPSTPKMQLRATMIFFLSTAAAILVFFLVALYIHQSAGVFMPQLAQYRTEMTIAVAGLSFVAMIVAKRAFARSIASAKDSLIPLETKLNQHRAALIRYIATCEMPALLAIVLFMLTGHFVLLVYAAVLLGFILALLPVKKRVVDQLGLDWQQQQELEQ